MDFFYSQSVEERTKYKSMLMIFGSLSNLFSESPKPYLDSRISENLFCHYLNAENLARFDCTADARKGSIGIGIKTWVGNGMQKIAEFNKLRPQYTHLEGQVLAEAISGYRNERIEFTMKTYGMSDMIYHCLVRDKGVIRIQECPLEPIRLDRLRVTNTSSKSIQFKDGLNEYSFNLSKSVLMKRFNNMNVIETLPVSIIEDPFDLLEKMFLNMMQPIREAESSQKIYLSLYSYSKRLGKFVPEKSGLNQWNAFGRKRHPDEVYIPVFQKDHRKTPGFFPERDTPFTLLLPNGQEMSAKICQDGDKALMSNPNKALGKWLLRDLLGLREGELLTYEMFEKYGIDSVKIEKLGELRYRINFAKIGSYEAFMGEDVSEDLTLEED